MIQVSLPLSRASRCHRSSHILRVEFIYKKWFFARILLRHIFAIKQDGYTLRLLYLGRSFIKILSKGFSSRPSPSRAKKLGWPRIVLSNTVFGTICVLTGDRTGSLTNRHRWCFMESVVNAFHHL